MHRLAPQLIPIFLIFGAVLAVYSGAFGNDFLINWDDPTYVSANPDVQSFTLENLRKIFTSFYAGNYAPLQMLSYMLDYQLWGANPFGFILVNVLLHGLNGILFYLLLGRLGMQSGLALLAALLFVVHPVQVESVAWISQRKNVLAMSFFLAAFWQYQAFTRDTTKRWAHYAAAIFCFLLALLTKPVVVIFPAVLLIYDVTLRQDRGRLPKILAEKIPFALLAAGASWLTVISQGEAVVKGYHGGSALATALTMVAVYKDYLVNLFWPLQLSALYLEDFKTGLDAEVVLAAVLLAATFASLLFFRQGARRPAIFWLSLFTLGFLPVSQVIPMMTLMNDRYLYFPMLGFAVYLVLLLQAVTDRCRLPARGVYILAVCCLVLLAPVAWLRTGVWSSSLTLWQDTVQKQPGSAWAWSHLGYSYRAAGDLPAAIDCYRQAVTLEPGYFQYHFELGRCYQQAGELEKAVQSYLAALRLEPGYTNASYSLALTYTVTGRHQAAVDILEPVARGNADPGLPLLSLLAANYYYVGNYPAAWRAYEQLWQDVNGAPDVAGMLALVALRLGEMETSSQLWQVAVTSGIAPVDLYLDWARMEALGRRREQALEFLARALTLGVRDRAALFDDPDFASLRGDSTFRSMIGR